MAFYRGPRIVTNGLVLALDAANPKSYAYGSTIWNDLSGNLNSGSLGNAPALNNDGGGSLVFNGVNTYVLLPAINTNSDFTLNFWTRRSSNTNPTLFSGILSNGYLQIRNYPTDVSLVRSNVLELGNFGSSTGTLLNKIYNITLTRIGTTFSCYIDGEFKNTLTVTGSFTTTNPTIGINTGFSEPYAGNIYSFSYYNRALSAAEVAQNYNAISSRFQYPLTTISTYLTLTQAAGLSIYDNTIENTTYLARYSSYASASAFALINEPII
jgi:hypothetical protein